MPGLSNSDNFVELLHYRCLECDTNLKHHLKFVSHNATYTSPKKQNELIDCFRQLII